MSSTAPRARASTRGRGLTRGISTSRGSSTTRGARGAYKVRGDSQDGATRKTTRGAKAATNNTPRQAIKQHSSGNNWQDRYAALEESRKRERANAIRNGIIADPDKPRRLAEAITPVGTCQDMCAEFERVERVVQKDVWKEETDPASLAANPLDREPDESRMVKKFRRAAAGIEEQLPSDLRPPSMLSKTCDYLFNTIVGQAENLGSVHHFVWDRTRAIRNDFSIQQISKAADLSIAIECYERIARFHILSLHQLALPIKPYDKYDWQQEREQLDRTLLSLMQYYEDSRGKITPPNEAEFRAYQVIFQIQDTVPDTEDKIQNWPKNIATHHKVKTAWRIYASVCTVNDMQGPLKPPTTHPIAQQDWHRFWRLIESPCTSYLMACVAEVYFNHVRRTILQALLKSAGSKNMLQWTVEEIRSMLAFDYDEDAEEFCERHGLPFTRVGDRTLLDLSVFKHKRLPDAKATATKQTRSHLVEQKRYGRTFPAVINGLTVKMAKAQGLMEEDEDEVMDLVDEAEAADDVSSEDGLFVSEKAKPSVGTSSFTNNTSNAVSAGFGQSSSSMFSPCANPAENALSFGKASEKVSPFAKPTENALFGKPTESVSPFAKSDGNSPASFGKPSNPRFVTADGSDTKDEFKTQFNTNNTTTTTSSFMSQPISDIIPKTTASIFAQPTKSASPFAQFATNGTTENKTSTFAPTGQPQTSFFASQDKKTTAAASPFTQANKTAAPSPFTQALNAEKTSTFRSPFLQAPETNGPGTADVEASASVLAQATAKSDSISPFFNFTKPVAATSLPSQPNKSPNQQTIADAGDTTLSTTPINTAQVPTQVAPNPFETKSWPHGFPADTTAQNKRPSTAKSVTFDFMTTSGKQNVEPGRVKDSSQSEERTESTLPQNNSTLPKGFSFTQPQPKPTQAATPQSENVLPRPPIKQEVDLSTILDRLAKDFTLDPSTGFLYQYVDFVLNQTVAQAQESVYLEHVEQEAKEYRSFKLAERYGLQWRDICRRKRLARHGRGQRQRANKRLHDLKSQPSEVSSIAGSDTSMPRRRPDQRSTMDEKFQQSMGTGGWSRLAAKLRNATSVSSSSITSQDQPKARVVSRTDNTGRIIRPALSGRASLIGSTTTPPARNTTRSNYFKRKALGLEPTNDVPRSKKRTISEISHEMDKSPSRSPALSSPRTEHTVFKLTKVNAEDDALLARLRAARESLYLSTAYFHKETNRPQSPQQLEEPATYNSPSMDRARAEARLQQSAGDVPAYRLRDSKFVARELYSKAIENARSLRETRSATGSRPESRISDHGHTNGINGDAALTTSNDFSNASPTTFDTPPTQPPSAPSNDADNVPPITFDAAGTHPLLSISSANDAPPPAIFHVPDNVSLPDDYNIAGSASPVASLNITEHTPLQPFESLATSSITLDNPTQSQAILHPSLGQDYTIKPTQIPESLSASFGASIGSQQPVESQSQHGSLDNSASHRSSWSGSQSKSAFGHNNPFAMLADDEQAEHDSAEDEVSDEQYVVEDASTGSVDDGYPVAGEEDNGYLEEEEDRDEPESEDGNEPTEEEVIEVDSEEEAELDSRDEDELDTEDDYYSEDDAEQYPQAGRLAHQKSALPPPNPALQAVGNNIDEAIELSD